MYTAEVIADSVSPEGHRITTVKAVYPHAVHKDMLRHRCMNRNVASFRAMPPEKLLEMLRGGGFFMPEVFGYRTKGMGQRNEATESGPTIDQDEAQKEWAAHVERSCELAEWMLERDIAKQQVNFILQDFCPLVEIITATDWSNFYALRTEVNNDGSPIARPEVYLAAKAIQTAIIESTPVELGHGQLHLPMLTSEERNLCDTQPEQEMYWIWVSAGRCARISFGDYEWWQEEPDGSHSRATRLIKSGHMSPFEQQARCFSQKRWGMINRIQDILTFTVWTEGLKKHEIEQIGRQIEYGGNLHGWDPARKELPYEWDYSLIKDTIISA